MEINFNNIKHLEALQGACLKALDDNIYTEQDKDFIMELGSYVFLLQVKKGTGSIKDYFNNINKPRCPCEE